MSSFLATFLLILLIAAPINGSNPRKLQETSLPGTPDTEMKCGSCPCNNPCNQSPPSPPPPSPPPPAPKPPTPSLTNCPPPPSFPPPSYIYITGPPGNLYPVDPYFSDSGRSSVVGLPLLLGCGFLGLLAFW